ncbi:FAD-dependent oxidoreductase [Microbacterium betulae]|uniref:FAD-dependent oxidoreductase n=1 Tax=Microbacterium betulae TaxID=2981139 RepID=A0AA97FGR9_9MICO|nr:FAD-dependent oxidoreductase [Microbacterium sp. AB]WOF23256.1 FAD-dependent oxidoreductase [Microbacterium sp. AB]
MRGTADVVVIGGGVLGAATAFELSERGHDVVLLERALPGRQGSGTTAGNLHIQAIHPERPGQDVPVDTARLLPLQREASLLWDELEARLDADLEVTRSGGFTVAETDAQERALREKHRWERAAGVPTEVMDGDSVRAASPSIGPSVRAATYCAWDGYANSLLAIPAYLRRASGLGARVYAHAPVRALDRRPEGTWLVTSDAGEFEAPFVVNAAGPWIQEVMALAGARIAMAPIAIQMHETVRAGRLLEVLVQHVGRGLSVKQVRTGNVVIGGGWPAGALRLGDYTPIDERSADGNMSDARRIVPAVSALRLSRAWAGPLAATPDEMPVVGAVPGHDGLFVMGGTYAFTFSPLWARTIAELIGRAAPAIEVDDLGPGRLLSPSTVGHRQEAVI